MVVKTNKTTDIWFNSKEKSSHTPILVHFTMTTLKVKTIFLYLLEQKQKLIGALTKNSLEHFRWYRCTDIYLDFKILISDIKWIFRGTPPNFLGDPRLGAPLKNMGAPFFFGGPGGPQKILKLKEKLGGPPRK